jgi:hypothetical protein
VRAPEDRQQELPGILVVNAMNHNERLIENYRESVWRRPKAMERLVELIEEALAVAAEEALPQSLLYLTVPPLLGAQGESARVCVVYRSIRPLRNDVRSAELPLLPAQLAFDVHNAFSLVAKPNASLQLLPKAGATKERRL